MYPQSGEFPRICDFVWWTVLRLWPHMYGVGQAFPATLSHSDWLSHLVIIPLNT